VKSPNDLPPPLIPCLRLPVVGRAGRPSRQGRGKMIHIDAIGKKKLYNIPNFGKEEILWQ